MTPPAPSSDWLHPVRLLRTRPFGARLVGELAATIGGGLPSGEAAGAAMDLLHDAYNENMADVAPALHPPAPMAVLSNELQVAAAVAHFTAAGRQVFALPAALVRDLDATDLGDVRLEDVLLPFEAFYVAFGAAFDAALPGPANRIDGAYVRRVVPGVDEAGRARPVALTVTVTSRRLRAPVDGEAARGWPLTRDSGYQAYFPLEGGEWKGVRGAQSPDRPGVRPRPTAASTLEEHVAYFLSAQRWLHAKGGDQHPDLVAAERRHLDFINEGEAAFRRALGLVMNALVYLTALGPAAQAATPAARPSDTPEALLRELAAIPPTAGRKIRRPVLARLLDGGYLPLRMVPPLADADGAAPDEEAGREVSPHFRRAHWRRQRVGPGRAGVRLTRVRATLVRADRGVPAQGRLRQVPPPT